MASAAGGSGAMRRRQAAALGDIIPRDSVVSSVAAWRVALISSAENN